MMEKMIYCFLKNEDSGKYLLFKELAFYLNDGDMLFADKITKNLLMEFITKNVNILD